DPARARAARSTRCGANLDAIATGVGRRGYAPGEATAPAPDAPRLRPSGSTTLRGRGRKPTGTCTIAMKTSVIATTAPPGATNDTDTKPLTCPGSAATCRC